MPDPVAKLTRREANAVMADRLHKASNGKITRAEARRQVDTARERGDRKRENR